MTTPPPAPTDETIQRVLFLASKAHIYTIPPLKSTRGYQASSWTNPTPGDPNPAREIFTARLRVLETATPISTTATSTTSRKNSSGPSNDEAEGERLTVSILLEDPSTGALFAEAPYTHPSVVEAAVDSSRFFAIRVVGPGPGGPGTTMTATLGVGFEDRAEAMEFGICLQGSAKVLGLVERGGGATGGKAGGGGGGRGEAGAAGVRDKGGIGGAGTGTNTTATAKRDWSLKEGESIRVDVGGRGARRKGSEKSHENGEDEDAGGRRGTGTAAFFSIKPPPPPPSQPSFAGGEGKAEPIPLLAPPPSAPVSRAEKRRSREIAANVQAAGQSKIATEALGFDDGEFGEFQ